MENISATVTIPKTEYDKMKTLLAWHEERLRAAASRRFGASGEQNLGGQLSVFNEAEISAGKEVAEPEFVEIERHFRARKRTETDCFPDDLPVETVVHELPKSERVCECGAPCGEQ
jgi:hypothetical protein